MEKQSFSDFCDIIARLRAPGGCPWDREQTHETLKKHLIEEAYEAYDAISSGDPEKMADELGDVLLQIVMHAQIGSDNGEFTIDDVIDAVSNKMINRHPHVFSDGNAETAEQVLDKWETIKKEERGQHSVYETMRCITRSLPALKRCDKIISKASKGGLLEKALDYPDEEPLSVEEEFGKELFEVCLKMPQKVADSEAALDEFLEKFMKKIKNIEENT